MSSEVERVRLVLEDSDATDFPSSRASNVRTLLIRNFLVVAPSHLPRPPSAQIKTPPDCSPVARAGQLWEPVSASRV